MEAVANLESAGGTRERPLAITAALVLGCAALLMLGVQPLVLGALVHAERLSVHQLAQAATVEMLALGLVSGGLAALVRHRNLALWGMVGALLLIASNLGCLAAQGLGFVALRGLAGAAGGILVWMAVGLITRSPSALRLSAVFLGAQALTQAALAAIIPVVEPALGANAGCALLAASGVLTFACVLAIPRNLPDLPARSEGSGRLNGPGLLGLVGTFLLMAGIVGVWVFVEQLGAQRGISPATVSFAVAASLATQVAGAAFIAWIGPKISAAAGLVVVCLGYVISLAILAWGRGDAAFLAGALLFGFLWTVSLPLFVPLLIGVDSSRRTAMLLPGAQLLGGAAGPQVTGLLVTSTSVQPVLGLGAALFGAASASILLAVVTQRRAQPAYKPT